jgi:2-succinyl-6-hydroxy-2,4-cyclohexadiene-1-carboxylate synthase
LDLSGAAQRSERLRNSAAGLASSLRLCGTGTQKPLWDQLGGFASPVLALAGSDDNRFAAHALRLAQLVPHGVASLVPGGGHAVHLAQPEQAGRIVRHWLDAAGPGLE